MRSTDPAFLCRSLPFHQLRLMQSLFLLTASPALQLALPAVAPVPTSPTASVMRTPPPMMCDKLGGAIPFLPLGTVGGASTASGESLLGITGAVTPRTRTQTRLAKQRQARRSAPSGRSVSSAPVGTAPGSRSRGVVPTEARPMTEGEVMQLTQQAAKATATLERLALEHEEEEAAFKEQVAAEDLNDTMLARHLQKRQAHAVQYQAAAATCELIKGKAELAERLFAAEQDTRAKQAKADATEERLKAERLAQEEASQRASKIRERFLAA